MDIFILKSILEGIHLAVYSSIKPGAYHRLRLDQESRLLVSNTLSTIDQIVEAIEYGERVRKGEIALTSIGIGRLIARALRESYRWNGGRVYPSTIIPQILYSIALSHSNIDSFVKDSGKVRKTLDLLLSISKWSEIKQVVDTLRSVHRDDMYEHLVSTGITQLAGIEGGVSFGEVFRVLGSRWPAFLSLDIRDYRIPDYVKLLMNYYKKFGDTENSIVALYLELVKDKMPDWAHRVVEEAFEKGLMSSREGAKKLFELETMLRKKDISFNEYVGLLAIIVSLAVFDGLRP